MAGTSLLALLDDIASVIDDVSVLTKVAARKTAGVLGDDLALNAEQVAGMTADRGLPVVWAVAPWLMKAIAVLGTAAMFLVGGGILAHGIPPLHHGIATHAWRGKPAGFLVAPLANVMVGMAAGALSLAAVKLFRTLFRRRKP